MILLEIIRDMFWGICRFFVWFITARDCEHCSKCTDIRLRGFISYSYDCELGNRMGKECQNTIRRKYFTRDKKAGGPIDQN